MELQDDNDDQPNSEICVSIKKSKLDQKLKINGDINKINKFKENFFVKNQQGF